MGDLEIVAIIGRRFIAAEEHASGGDVGRRREGLGFLVAARRALEAHHVEELRRGGARRVPARGVHRGEDVADALALDRAGVDEVDADALGAELQAEFTAPRVHRRLGDHVSRARIIGRAAEDGRNVDDRTALGDVLGRDARDIPRDAEDVAQRLANGLAVGRAGLLERGEFLRRQGQVLDRLLGPGAPGVVDQNIDPPELLHHLGDASADRGDVAAVERHGREPRRVRAGRLEQRLGSGLGAIGRAARHHHGCAFCKVVGDDMPAQIARRAGDDGDLAGQTARNIALQSRRSGDDLGFSHGTLLTELQQRLASLYVSFKPWGGELRTFQLAQRTHQGSGSPEPIAAHASSSASRLLRPISGSAWLTT